MGAGVLMEGGHWNRAIWMKLNEMRKSGIGCDVELLTEDGGRPHPAHLCVLVAASTHMKTQLQGMTLSKDTVIHLSGFSDRVLEAILEFMYSGCLAADGQLITEVEKAAKILQMRELVMLCAKITEKQKSIPEHDQLVMLENSSWNKNVWHNLNVFRHNKQFCNVTLQIDDSTSFEAHACLLMAASSYFRRHLPSNRIEEGMSICLRLTSLGLSRSVIESVLEYVYVGSISCSSQDLLAVIDFASILKIEKLACLLEGIQKKYQVLKATQNNSNENVETKEGITNAEESKDVKSTEEVAEGINYTEEAAAGVGYTEEYMGTEDVGIVDTEEMDTTHEPTEEAAKEVTNAAVPSTVPQHQSGLGTSSLLEPDQTVQNLGVVSGEELQNLLIDSAQTLKLVQSEDGQAFSVVLDSLQESMDTSGHEPQASETVATAANPGFTLLSGDLNSAANGQNTEYILGEDHHKVKIQQTYDDSQLSMAEAGKTKLYDEVPLDHNIEFLRNADGAFTCPYCDKTFRKLFAAQVHGVKHTGQRPFTCRLCGMGFKFKANVLQHLKLHSGEKPHACKVCGKQFARIWDIQVHERTHTKEKPYKCRFCPKSFAQGANCHSHMKRVHNIGGDDRKARSLTAAAVQGNFECVQCGKHFSSPQALANHERNIHAGDRESVACETCGVSFTSKYGLKRHVDRGACLKNMGKKTYHELKAVSGPQDCSHCSQAFGNFEALRDHILTSGCMDQMEQPPHFFRDSHRFVCFKCSTSFENFLEFRMHDESRGCGKVLDDDLSGSGRVKVETGMEYSRKGSKVVCTSCDRSFVSLQGLRRHKIRGACEKNARNNNMALLDKPYVPCGECGEIFKNVVLLAEHEGSGTCSLKSTKKTAEKASCPDCKMAFNSTLALKRHVEKGVCQEGEQQAQQYSCQNCGSSYTSAESVRRHIENGYCERELLIAAGDNDTELDSKGEGKESFGDLQGHGETNTCNEAQEFGTVNDDVEMRETDNETSEENEEKADPLGSSDIPRQTTRSRAQNPANKTKQVLLVCNTCNAVFETTTKLEKHKRSQHGTKKCVDGSLLLPVSCDVCDKIFERQAGLETHRQKFPEGACRKWKERTRATLMMTCQKCDARFVSVSLLKKHYVAAHKVKFRE